MNIPKDVDFGLDNFQKPKVLSTSESIAQYILFILLLKPGNLPGMPHIGLNIKELIYSFTDDFKPELLKEAIYNQCMELFPYIVSSELYVGLISYQGRDYIVIKIPIEIDESNETISYAFYKDSGNQIKFGYEID